MLFYNYVEKLEYKDFNSSSDVVGAYLYTLAQAIQRPR